MRYLGVYWFCLSSAVLKKSMSCGQTCFAGIKFQDITTLLLDTKAFKDTIDLFVERYKDKNISVVAGKSIPDF